MPEEDNHHSEIKSEIAQEKPRDAEGHFIHADPPKPGEQSHQNPVEKFVKDHTSYHKSQDDILDVHVGNPLHKITQLLEEIKKQKAFSFTLKGSLGIAGVALALGVFGIFGGGKILCDRGIQSQIGIVKVLKVVEEDSAGIPVLSNILSFFSPKKVSLRTVLIKDNGDAVNLPYSKNVNLTQYNNYQAIVTGDYDSCGQTLTVSDPQGIENYPK